MAALRVPCRIWSSAPGIGYRIPGTATIPEQIVANRQPYYEALDAADAAWEDKKIDVGAMEDFLGRALAVQLASVLEAASGPE
jgi:hypothetical protein